MKREYRTGVLTVVFNYCVSAAMVWMISIPLIFSRLPSHVFYPWLAIALAFAAWLGFGVYKGSTSVYTIDDKGIIISELSRIERVVWDEMSVVRRRPFINDVPVYDLILKDGTKRKLNVNMGRQFLADLKRSLPATVQWDDS